MDLHGVERLLSALARSAKLKGLYIDCPHYSPMGFWDPRKPPFSLSPTSCPKTHFHPPL